MEALEPQMVLLVQHDAESVLDQKRGTRTNPSIRIQPGQLFAYQVTFVQQLPVGAVHLVESKFGRPAQEYRVTGGLLHEVEDILSLGFRVASLKHPSGQVSSQPDAGRE